MKKHILIVANPGESNSENYCEGVLKDIENYKAFFKSPYGGYWYDSEITILQRPTESEFKTNINNMKNMDYSKIIFTGHGYYSKSKDSTVLELRKYNEIDSQELKNGSTRQTIILDCCREIFDEVLEERLFEKFAKAFKPVNPAQCRMYYEKKIMQCLPSFVINYSCDINEVSRDDSTRGGYFSYNLLKVATDWAENNNTDISRNYDTLSIVKAFILTKENVKKLSNYEQNPQIDKNRSGEYFPFSIVA